MVYAFSLTGDLIWQYQLPNNKYGSPISFSSPTLTADGTLIVTTNQGIYAFKDIAADFRYEHVNGTETTIQFTDLSTKGNNRYYWIFGDGNISREQNPIHEYSYPGTYRVVLLVEHNGTIDLMRNKTITVELYDITPPSNVTAYINNNLTSGGVFNQTQIISLNATDKYSAVVIYYTVDGSNPMNSSTQRVYKEPFEVEVDTTLSMVACDSAGNWGNITSIDFRITDVTRINSTLIDEIQSMLDNTEAYSKILFDFDTIYGANFTVNKPLNIISNNNTKLVGANGNPSITFAKGSEGSILNGFEIVNDEGDGVLIEADGILIRNCLVNVTNATGINIFRSNGTIIMDTGVCNADVGIVVNQSTNTLIDGVSVRDCYSDGIWVYQSKHTIIVNSLIEDNGKDPYKLLYGENEIVPAQNFGLNFKVNVPASESRANNILIDDSTDNYIYNNTINYGYFGIHLYHTTADTVIDANRIYETIGDAILLGKRYYNVNITHNLIDGCYNGIDFMGYSENVTIKQNTIKLLHTHDGDLFSFVYPNLIEQMASYVYEEYIGSDQFFNHQSNGIQVSYPASNFDEGNTVIIDNVVIRLSHRSWEARKYTGYINAGCDSYGYNLMDGSSSYNLTDFGGATSYREGKVDLVIDRIGDATFRLRLINRLDNHYLSEIPEFDVIFTTGGFTQTVKFINDSAIAEFDVSMAVSDIEAIISGEIRKSAHFDIPITEGYTSSNRAFDPGFEKGEAYNNPDPVIPKIPPEEDDYKPNDPIVGPPISEPSNPIVNPPISESVESVESVDSEEPETGYGNGTGNGQGTGNGTGTGDGDGNGSSGSFGTGKNNIFGELNKLSGQVADFAGIGDVSSSEDVSDDSADGMDRSSEGGSDAGSGETVHAYEVSKVIDVDESNWKFVVAVVLFSCIVLCGYVYRKRRGDGGEI